MSQTSRCAWSGAQLLGGDGAVLAESSGRGGIVTPQADAMDLGTAAAGARIQRRATASSTPGRSRAAAAP